MPCTPEKRSNRPSSHQASPEWATLPSLSEILTLVTAVTRSLLRHGCKIPRSLHDLLRFINNFIINLLILKLIKSFFVGFINLCFVIHPGSTLINLCFVILPGSSFITLCFVIHPGVEFRPVCSSTSGPGQMTSTFPTALRGTLVPYARRKIGPPTS